MRAILEAISLYLQRVRTYNPVVILVELVLIGAVVWWVTRFLRGTRGARLVKGFALLLACVYVVILMLPERLGWQRIQLLYGHFLLFAFAAVVVAFQPELRQAFIQIGQARYYRSARGQIEHVANTLADSAAYLSRNRIGAIIAVERTVGLGSFIQAGTVLNANLTAPLLNTIFYPGSPLHDMGVIIRDGRIAAAGCQFPLAESEEVDPSPGSRHRAALGLAKEGDAVVIVVSEETGRVSLAYEGHLYLGLAVENLLEALRTLLAAPRLPRRHQAPSPDTTP